MNNNIYGPIILGTLFFLFSCSPEELKKNPESQAKETSQGETVTKHDPIEDDIKYQAVFKKVSMEVDEALIHHPRRGKIGFAHVFWDEKKKMLREKYGIDWKTPKEMNPNIFFD